jgi:hypothetical protein
MSCGGPAGMGFGFGIVRAGLDMRRPWTRGRYCCAGWLCGPREAQRANAGGRGDASTSVSYASCRAPSAPWLRVRLCAQIGAWGGEVGA